MPGPNVSLCIKFRGRAKWHKEFSQADCAEEINFAVHQGGLLELVLDDAHENGSAIRPESSSQIVWGNLQLRK